MELIDWNKDNLKDPGFKQHILYINCYHVFVFFYLLLQQQIQEFFLLKRRPGPMGIFQLLLFFSFSINSNSQLLGVTISHLSPSLHGSATHYILTIWSMKCEKNSCNNKNLNCIKLNYKQIYISIKNYNHDKCFQFKNEIMSDFHCLMFA